MLGSYNYISGIDINSPVFAIGGVNITNLTLRDNIILHTDAGTSAPVIVPVGFGEFLFERNVISGINSAGHPAIELEAFFGNFTLLNNDIYSSDDEGVKAGTEFFGNFRAENNKIYSGKEGILLKKFVGKFSAENNLIFSGADEIVVE